MVNVNRHCQAHHTLCSEGGDAGRTAGVSSQPTSDESAGGLLGGLGGLLNKLPSCTSPVRWARDIETRLVVSVLQ